LNNELYEKYKAALINEPSPCLFLDLDAFETNMNWAIQNAGSKKIRIATKSIRSVEVLKTILNHSNTFQGLMAFTLAEALWLRDLGFKDILVGYPSCDHKSLQQLALNPQGITLMVDLPEHIDLLEKYFIDQKFSICIDVDLSMDLPALRFGVFRSSIQSEDGLLILIKRIINSSKVTIVGVMGYEAQIAGVGDEKSFLIRFLKNLSVKKLRKRREVFFNLIKKHFPENIFVNGGGTGSLDSTRDENCVTELTVGSGFYAPALFDHYQNFKLKPALAFNLPIVRHPTPDIFTCLGGGYIASGAIEKSKQPIPYLPLGLELMPFEGAGEVQTPVKNTKGHPLKVGDFIILRHAKAGEICERFNSIALIKNGKCLGHVPTYRGEGKCFL
jgi:D-serine deaminase-like pyridoxal phosphate-dependent protein